MITIDFSEFITYVRIISSHITITIWLALV